MKKLSVRLTALALVLITLMSMLPVSIFASEATATADDIMKLSVASTTGLPGNEVKVTISLTNNPGIMSLKFDVKYDEVLTLTNVEFSSEFGGYVTAETPYKNPQILSFMSSSEVSADGTFATLTFKISEDAEDNYAAIISVTYDPDDVFDSNLDNVDMAVVNGGVMIYHGIPGDIDSNGSTNLKDAILLFRHIAGGDIDVDSAALDVNGDNKINNKDAVTLLKYVTGWPNIQIFRGEICTHELVHYAKKNATCTEAGNVEYWQCALCDRFYIDSKGTEQVLEEDTVLAATGHIIVIDPPKVPTYDVPGLTEGSHCSTCGEVIKAQEVIPALKKDEYAITYYLSNGDKYLESVIGKDNVGKYASQDGLQLDELDVDGYKFEGWFTAPNGAGEYINQIPVGSTGDMKLYAHFTKYVYTIKFDSPDVLVADRTYTVDTGAVLENPSWFGYTFVGWSIDGDIVTEIPVGSTGNKTLRANWTSNRNRGQAVNQLKSPDIIEDLANSRYLFVYEIGTIENVPLNIIENFGNSEGIVINNQYTISSKIKEGMETVISQTVLEATSKTSSWTLSEDWNESASATNEHEQEKGQVDERTDINGNVVGGEYYISNVTGGCTSTSSNSGGANSSSSKVTTNNSTGINGKYYNESELNTSVDVSVSASIGAGYGPIKAEVSAGMDSNVSTHDKTTTELASHRESNIGTYDENNSNAYWNSSNSATSSWNTTNSYKNSSETSRQEEISKIISEVVYDRYGYTSTNSRGGSNSATNAQEDSVAKENGYSSTLEYSIETETIITKTIEKKSDATGYYRLVNAGTVHVFAVVGYDIATNSYFTYTYNVLDNERHEYLDYSKDNANFNDCENAAIPFEVPYEIHEFISGVVAKTAGLTVDTETGIVTEYNGTDANVIIPEYVSVNNGDGTYSAIRVRGFSSDAFNGNKTVKAVYLPKFITEIPDNAFEGCIALEAVIGYGITSIGDEAFKGCTSLKSFNVDEFVTSLGVNAFEGTTEITVKAANKDVAIAAINSGSKKITVNIAKLEVGEFDNEKVVISDATTYFAFIGNGSTYKNLQIESYADETVINNVVFVENATTPIKLGSSVVNLNRVKVENSPAFALVLTADNVTLKLFQTVSLSSVDGNAVLSKNVTLQKYDDEVAATLKVSGNYLVYGSINNAKMLSVDGDIKYISEEEYNNLLVANKVTFEANGGTVSESSKIVYKGLSYGSLPIPEREHYNFEGWFTSKTGGDKITSDSKVISSGSHILYAQWTPKSYTVTFNANGGSSSEASKVVYCDAAWGTLPTATRQYYQFDGWYTAVEGGEKVTELTAMTRSSDITVYAHWTPIAFTLTFDANGGSVSETSRLVFCDVALGTLPTPTKDYHYFDGWYIGETNVTENTVFANPTNVTVYAKWVQKEVKGWVNISDLPADAQVVNTKWTYTRTQHQESTASSIDGWSRIGNYWREIGRGNTYYATFPSGYDTNNTYYQTFARSPYTAYDNGSTKREVSNSWAGYIYWHWMYNVAYSTRTDRTISHRYGAWDVYGNYSASAPVYKYFTAIASTVDCPYLSKGYCCSQNLSSYNCVNIITNTTNVGTPRMFRFDYYATSYIDYQMIYQYQRITNEESYTEISNGGEISNVQKLVQYREK